MGRKKRDYKAEYARRIARGKKLGLSKSQARGHAKPGEKSIRVKAVKSDALLEAALRNLSKIGKQGEAAKRAGISAERFRRFLYDNSLATRKGRKWVIHDNRLKQLRSIIDGRYVDLKLRGDQVSLNGKFMAGVGRFLKTNDYSFVEPFIGQSVRDAKGKRHVFETDPNTLYRLSGAQDEPFEQNYRIIA